MKKYVYINNTITIINVQWDERISIDIIDELKVLYMPPIATGGIFNKKVALFKVLLDDL